MKTMLHRVLLFLGMGGVVSIVRVSPSGMINLLLPYSLSLRRLLSLGFHLVLSLC
jgi:hypothetical protein